MLRALLAGLLLSCFVSAQDFYLYSEFRRVGPAGEVAPQDQGGRPREILSPLLARNSHATFHVVVEAPPGKHFYLYVGSNPEGMFKVQVYKEMYQSEAAQTPDRLLPVTLPYLSHIPDRYHGLANQRVESFLLDVFVPADAPPGRVKLEPQLSCDGRWVAYPMEVRISTVTVPPHKKTAARLPGVEESTGEIVLGPLREYLCGKPETIGRGGPLSIRQIIRRNVLEDLAIARRRERETGQEAVAAGLLRGLAMDRESFCAAEKIASEWGPEWYLRGRDFLYEGEPAPRRR